MKLYDLLFDDPSLILDETADERIHFPDELLRVMRQTQYNMSPILATACHSETGGFVVCVCCEYVARPEHLSVSRCVCTIFYQHGGRCN